MTAQVRTLPAPSMLMGEATATGALVVAPQTFGEVIAFAEHMATSRFVPAHLRGRDKAGDCMAVCLQALRWGMDPFMVAQDTYFVKDGAPPGYGAKLINAVIYARAPLDGRLHITFAGEWPNNSRVCTVAGRFRGDPNLHERVVEASRITTRNSPLWKTDPDQQLAYYATRAWARLYCPDVILGVVAADEVAPVVGGDITPPTAAGAVTGAALLAQASAGAAVEAIDAETIDPETGEVTPAEPQRDAFGLPPVDAEIRDWSPEIAQFMEQLAARATTREEVDAFCATNRPMIDRLPEAERTKLRAKVKAHKAGLAKAGAEPAAGELV